MFLDNVRSVHANNLVKLTSTGIQVDLQDGSTTYHFNIPYSCIDSPVGEEVSIIFDVTLEFRKYVRNELIWSYLNSFSCSSRKKRKLVIQFHTMVEVEQLIAEIYTRKFG